MTQNELLYGSIEPLPESRLLRVGPLTILYERGFLRYVKWGNHEVVRMMYFALRDENWGTLPPILSDETTKCDGQPAPGNGELTGKTISIAYTLHYENKQGRLFEWKAQIEILDSGEINFEIDGTAFQAFRKNRAGFCLLHPIVGTAGRPVELTHEDGSREESCFPEVIDPQNPFKRLQSMRWQHATGYWFEAIFEGELFETEDQRNWTDASYKTFCTPLDKPFPVDVKAGETVWQRLTFRPAEDLPSLPLISEPVIEVWVDETHHTRLPELGLGASTETENLTSQAGIFLKNLGLNFYQIRVKPGEEGWVGEFRREVTQAQMLDLPLSVSLLLTDQVDAEVENFIREVSASTVRLQIVLLLGDAPVTSVEILQKAVSPLRRAWPEVQVGAGTDFNFTEFNRHRFDPTGLDFVSYGIHPQEHAFDHRTLIENTAAQADTVHSTRSFYGDAPVRIAFVTLRKRASSIDSTDPRQPSLWAAGWTLGSLKHLAEAGAAAVSYYQTAGKQGFCNLDGQPYPSAILLGAVQKLQGGEVIRTETSEPLACSSLLVKKGEERYYFLTNHTAQPLAVRLPERPVEVRKLTVFPAKTESVASPKIDVITLEPFGVYELSMTSDQ